MLAQGKSMGPTPEPLGAPGPAVFVVAIYIYIYIGMATGWYPLIHIYIYTHVPQRIHSQKYIHKTVPQRGTQVCIFIHTRGVGGRRPPPPWLIELGLLGL